MGFQSIRFQLSMVPSILHEKCQKHLFPLHCHPQSQRITISGNTWVLPWTHHQLDLLEDRCCLQIGSGRIEYCWKIVCLGSRNSKAGTINSTVFKKQVRWCSWTSISVKRSQNSSVVTDRDSIFKIIIDWVRWHQSLYDSLLIWFSLYCY